MWRAASQQKKSLLGPSLFPDGVKLFSGAHRKDLTLHFSLFVLPMEFFIRRTSVQYPWALLCAGLLSGLALYREKRCSQVWALVQKFCCLLCNTTVVMTKPFSTPILPTYVRSKCLWIGSCGPHKRLTQWQSQLSNNINLSTLWREIWKKDHIRKLLCLASDVSNLGSLTLALPWIPSTNQQTWCTRCQGGF